MFFGDLYIGGRLIKEALHRAVGLPRDASMFSTLFVLGVAAAALADIAAPVLRRVFRPRRPSFAQAMIATAVAREIPRGIGGAQSRDTPFAGATITVSILAHALHALAGQLSRIPSAMVAFRRGFRI
ncbi:MAG TPA: hypothetical protein VGN08_04470 [Solirubrobacteraceae bacterium]|jgi:hypothetical protein